MFNFNRTKRNVNTASEAQLRPKLYFNFNTTYHTTPLYNPKSSLKEKYQHTNLRLFKQKQNIKEDNQPQMLKLVKQIPSQKFINLTQLNKLQFSSLSYSVNQLIKFSKMIIQSHTQRRIIAKTFNLERLIQIIAQNYKEVSYHNFTHAFSILQALFQCYNRSQMLRQSITQKNWFFIFIAALVHDINHPGTNNGFQVKAKTKYAIQAQNQSVLQKMHLNFFWACLRQNSQVNFLHGYSKNQSNDIKKLITRLILATDVSKHFKGVQYIQTFNKNKELLKGQNAMVLLQQLFHACDISNPCLNFDNYMNWSALVTYQFNDITLKQQKMELPVTSFLKYQNMNKFYKGQVGFCNGFVLPIWKELSIVYPGLDQFVQNISSNVQKLQEKIKETQ